MNVAADESLAGFALCFLRGRSLTLFRRISIALSITPFASIKRVATIVETRSGPLAQFLYELRRDLHRWLVVYSSFFSLLIGNFLFSALSYKTARTESLGAGLTNFSPAQ